MPSFGDPRGVKRASRADQIHQAVGGRNAVVLMILRCFERQGAHNHYQSGSCLVDSNVHTRGVWGFVSGGLGCARRGGWLSDWIPQSDGREQ